MVEEILKTGCSIKHASKVFNINFSTAKAIMQIYKREGRIGKKLKRDKKKKRKITKCRKVLKNYTRPIRKRLKRRTPGKKKDQI
jgi:transposase